MPLAAYRKGDGFLELGGDFPVISIEYSMFDPSIYYSFRLARLLDWQLWLFVYKKEIESVHVIIQ